MRYHYVRPPPPPSNHGQGDVREEKRSGEEMPCTDTSGVGVDEHLPCDAPGAQPKRDNDLDY